MSAPSMILVDPSPKTRSKEVEVAFDPPRRHIDLPIVSASRARRSLARFAQDPGCSAERIPDSFIRPVVALIVDPNTVRNHFKRNREGVVVGLLEAPDSGSDCQLIETDFMVTYTPLRHDGVAAPTRLRLQTSRGWCPARPIRTGKKGFLAGYEKLK
jgi:hypothetical protein